MVNRFKKQTRKRLSIQDFLNKTLANLQERHILNLQFVSAADHGGTGIGVETDEEGRVKYPAFCFIRC